MTVHVRDTLNVLFIRKENKFNACTELRVTQMFQLAGEIKIKR